MFKNPITPKGGIRRKVLPHNALRRQRIFLRLKPPETRFRHQKAGPFRATSPPPQTENAERFQRGWPEKNRFFDAAEGPDFIPPGTKKK